jgi:single-stranded DNA-binding protein
MTIDVAFHGFCASDAELRTSKAGKAWVRLRVGVGKDEDIQWTSVAVFGKAAEAAGKLRKGDRVYVEGTIKLDTWTGNDGVERHGLSVASFKCERTHRIGRDRVKRSDEAAPAGTSARPTAPSSNFYNDEIPFAAEWR